MTTGARRCATIALTMSLFAAVGCQEVIATHGHRIDEERIARIQPGVSTQRDVLNTFGSPSTIGTFDSTTWYYIQRRQEDTNFFSQDVLSQDVLAVAFDQNGMVSEIKRRDLADARTVEPVDRETPTTGNEITVVEQLIGNIGRFNTQEAPPTSVGP